MIPRSVAVLLVALVQGAVAPQTAPQSAPVADDQPADAGKPGAVHVELPDTEGDTCLVCHDSIGKGKVVHGPVAAGACTSCHEFTGEGDATRVALAGGTAKDNTVALCGTCHEDKLKASQADGAHAPVALGDCVSCHDPHSSDEPYQVKGPQVDLCGTCHDNVATDVKKSVPHLPAAAACSLCHDPHGGTQPTRLYAPVNALCLACHSVAVDAAAVPKTAWLSGRATPESLTPLRAPAVRIVLDPLARRGHPVMGHPVAGTQDRLDPPGPLTCASCHSPHGTDMARLLRYGEGDGTAFCVKCHK